MESLLRDMKSQTHGAVSRTTKHRTLSVKVSGLARCEGKFILLAFFNSGIQIKVLELESMSDICGGQYKYYWLTFLYRDVIRLICESLGHDVDRARRFRSRGKTQEGQATYDYKANKYCFCGES